MSLHYLTERVSLSSQLKEDINELEKAMYKGSEKIVKLRLNLIIDEINKLNNKDYKKVEETEKIMEAILRNSNFLEHMSDGAVIFIVFAAHISKDYAFKLISPEELNHKGRFQRTALHYAVQKQLTDVVRLLLEAGADVNCKTEIGFTPLHLATSLENEEICEILLNFGAEVEPKSPNLSSSLYSCSFPTSPILSSPLSNVCGRCSIKKLLVEPDETFDAFYHNEYNEEEDSTLVFNQKITKRLIDRGANLDKPFLEVCSWRNLEPFKFLLQFDVNVNVKDVSGNSPLHYAADVNSFKIVSFLLEKGLDINIRNSKNETPLFYMLRHNIGHDQFLDMIEYLVDRGADVNARDEFGATALHHVSSSNESNHGVECLLELGADFKLKHKGDFEMAFFPNAHFYRGRMALISFIALHENELGDYINCYFNKVPEELPIAHVYFKKCRLEVEKLKSTKIVQGSTVSFYDFLTGGFYNAVQLVKNEEIKKVLVSRKYYEELWCYDFLFEKRLERVIILKDAVDKMESFLTNCVSHLPTVVSRMILNELSSSDFRRFEHCSISYQNPLEQEPDINLELVKSYPAKIVEIGEIGIMLTLYPGMTPALLSYAKMEKFVDFADLEDIKDSIFEVFYWGRHPVSGQMILTL